jgi:hypothetical protein
MGPPVQFRWLAWSFLASRLKSKTARDYERTLKVGRSEQNDKCKYEISKDINRTFPYNVYFRDDAFGQLQLRNVLETYSVYRKDVGYCQSMNFVVAFILLVSGGDEKQTFWFFFSILEKSHASIPFDGLAGFYQCGFPLLMQYQAVFKDLFAELMPALHQHFENEDFPESLWVHKWFSTLFLYSFPFDFCIRAWDNILAYGTRFIFNISLAVLQQLEGELMGCGMVEILELFKKLKRENGEDSILPPVEVMIEKAQCINIPLERVRTLFGRHKIARPEIRLAEDQRRKQTFTTAPEIEIIAADEGEMAQIKLRKRAKKKKRTTNDSLKLQAAEIERQQQVFPSEAIPATQGGEILEDYEAALNFTEVRGASEE